MIGLLVLIFQTLLSAAVGTGTCLYLWYRLGLFDEEFDYTNYGDDNV